MRIVANLQQIVTLTAAQYQELITNNSITLSNGKTYNYNENTLYMVPEINPEIKSGTTSYWTSISNYIPAAGEILIYTDKTTITENGNVIAIPGIKIGDGLAYGIDLPFVGDDIERDIMNHINNTTIHITAAERTKWNNKINCENTVSDETLILNRN